MKIRQGDVDLIGEQNGASAAFLLLHAGGENRKVWRPVMRRLAQADMGAVAYDQRGHGESGGDASDGIEAFGSDVSAMLRVHPEARIVVGASLGGFAAILALADKGQHSRMDGLVLVDVVPVPDSARVRAFLAPREGLAAAPLIDDILSKGEMLQAAAARLDLPILLVRAGPRSPLSDQEVADLRSLCPQLRVERIDLAGHLIARDAPEELAERLIGFRRGLCDRGE